MQNSTKIAGVIPLTLVLGEGKGGKVASSCNYVCYALIVHFLLEDQVFKFIENKVLQSLFPAVCYPENVFRGKVNDIRDPYDHSSLTCTKLHLFLVL